MQLEIWDGENRQKGREARQLEAQPKPQGTVTFKWQMEERSPGRKTEKVPSGGCQEDHASIRATAQPLRERRRESTQRALNSGGYGRASIRQDLSAACCIRPPGGQSLGGMERACSVEW